MDFPFKLKRSFDEVIDLATVRSDRTNPMAIRDIPIKRQKIHPTSRAHEQDYRIMVEVENPDSGPDVGLPSCITGRGKNLDVSELTSSGNYRGDINVRAKEVSREQFIQKMYSSKENQLNPMSPIDSSRMSSQPVVGSACLNLKIPEIPAAALLTTSPRRANEVPMNIDDSGNCYEGRALFPPLFHHPSLRSLSVLRSGGRNLLWPTEVKTTTGRGPFSRRGNKNASGSSSSASATGGCSAFALLESRSTDQHQQRGTSDIASAADEQVIGPVETCTECQKVFKRKVYLQRHMEREHWLPAKVFKCEDCKYETKHQSNLSVHRRTHTGERPYHCGACGQRYTQGHLLKSHIRSRHTGNLRFYNLDKRSDSTRGRKSLDFKHDLGLYLSMPVKENPLVSTFLNETDSINAQSIRNSELFYRQRERFSTYLSNLPGSSLTNPSLWSLPLPPNSKMSRELLDSGINSSTSASYFAFGIVPQKMPNDLPYLSPVTNLSFLSRPVNLSNFPALSDFASNGTQLLSAAEKKPSCPPGDVLSLFSSHHHQQQHPPTVVRVPDSILCSYQLPTDKGSVCSGTSHSGTAHSGSAYASATQSTDLFRDCNTSQEFAVDLRVTKQPQIDTDAAAVAGSSDTPVAQLIADKVDICADDGEESCSRQNSSDLNPREISSELEHTEQSKKGRVLSIETSQEDSKYLLRHLVRRFHEENRIQTGKIIGSEAPTENDMQIPEDLSTVFQTSSSAADECKTNRSNGMIRPTTVEAMLSHLDSDDESRSPCSTSTDHRSTTPSTGNGLKETRSASASIPASAAFDSVVCSHYHKLQKFRKIVFRFVNAFAPNSLGINDDDDSFAETDLIDQIVHAAMFSDVE